MYESTVKESHRGDKKRRNNTVITTKSTANKQGIISPKDALLPCCASRQMLNINQTKKILSEFEGKDEFMQDAFL